MKSSFNPNVFAVSLALLLSTVCRSSLAESSGNQLPQPDPPSRQDRRDLQGLDAELPAAGEGPPRARPTCCSSCSTMSASACARTFGGPVPTPHLDKLADNGLKYNRFHTTALCAARRARRCSPAAIITACGTGVIIEMGTGFPGYTGIIPRSTALVPQMLRDNGYATGMFGKWHNTPEPDISPAGPFDRWPTGLGFDYFYGFNQGETNQYYPTLYRNTTSVAAAEDAGAGLPLHRRHDRRGDRLDAQRPRRRSATSRGSTTSAPPASTPRTSAPKEWREKFAGKFDHGWDKQRELTHAKQLEMGIIPAGHEAHAAAEGDSRVGRPVGRREEGLHAG